MSVDGPLKQIFEEAMREVKEWPAWMKSREIEGSASRTVLSGTERCTPSNGCRQPQDDKND
jgi:hypothetical protein